MASGISEERRIQDVNDTCSTTYTGNYESMTCAEKIIMDGWKMDY